MSDGVWIRTTRGWVQRDQITTISDHRGYARVHIAGERFRRPVYLQNQHGLRVFGAWLDTADGLAKCINPTPRSDTPS